MRVLKALGLVILSRNGWNKLVDYHNYTQETIKKLNRYKDRFRKEMYQSKEQIVIMWVDSLYQMEEAIRQETILNMEEQNE